MGVLVLSIVGAWVLAEGGIGDHLGDHTGVAAEEEPEEEGGNNRSLIKKNMLGKHDSVLGGQEAIHPSTRAVGQEPMVDAPMRQFPRPTFPRFISITRRAKSPKMT